MQSYSVYIHIPFCRHRCAYCDFNTYAGQETRIPDYVAALQREIQSLTASAVERFPVHTVYFGGGTPSLLSISAFDKILKKLSQSFLLEKNAEISIEANPGTLSASYLKELRATGVNRLSLGMQSANPAELIFLERQHQFADVINAVKWARQAGFDNLSLDLIFGLPEQQLGNWQASLSQAVDLTPEHFSLYALTIEHGTPLGRWAERGLVSHPDPDLAAEMYELACDRLASAGYFQYEISNWARSKAKWEIRNGDRHSIFENPTCATQNPAWACRHNLQYWRNQPYLGFGAGAHGFVSGIRTSNVLAPGAYLKRLTQISNLLPFPRTPATVSAQKIDHQTEMGETMMMGLRLTREGVSRSVFQARFGQDLCAVFSTQIDRLINWGLLEWVGKDGEVLRLTPKSRLLGNRVFVEFV